VAEDKVRLKGYTGDPRDIAEVQAYWEQLEPVARIEVLRHIINEQCRMLGVPPPAFRATATFSLSDPNSAADYDRFTREIVFYIRQVSYSRQVNGTVPVIQRIDLALETVLHETAHHVDSTFRAEEQRQILSGRVQSSTWLESRNAWYQRNAGPVDHPDIYNVGFQWMNEHFLHQRDYLIQTMTWIDQDRSWYRPQLDENLRVQNSSYPTPPIEQDYGAPDNPPVEQIRGDIDPAILNLRNWLRNPYYWIDARAPIELHRHHVRDIWYGSMQSTGGDPTRALAVAAEGTRPDRAPEENRIQHEARLSSLPSRAFGNYLGFTGIEKTQGFFMAAARSYAAGAHADGLAGWFSGAFDWIDSLFRGDGRRVEPGLLWADTLGVSFGASLRWNIYQPIDPFLQTVPAANEALPIRIGAWFPEGYVSDIVVPAPQSLINGHPIEVRAVNEKNQAYTMNVLLDRGTGKVTFGHVDRSSYRLSHYDPWYFSGTPAGSHDDARVVADARGVYIQPSSAYHAVTQQLQSHQEIQNRLLHNLGDLQANQHWLHGQMQRQQLTEQQLRLNQQQQEETQRRISETHAQLQGNTNMLTNLYHQHASAVDQLHNTLTRQTQDQTLLQQLEQQRQRHQDQIENSRRTQLDAQEHQRRVDDRERAREREARDEEQRRSQNQLNQPFGITAPASEPFTWTFGPASDPSRVFVGGPGKDIVGNPHHPQ
jgi:hypothetical protein